MSNKSSTPFWGQAWELTIMYVTAGGDTVPFTISSTAWDPEPLKITFEVLQSTIPSPFWYADIAVYNLNTETIDTIVLRAVSVSLKAGFQTGDALYSEIWNGPVLQVLLDRENVVDQRITLHCLANPIVMQNPVAFSMGKQSSQAQALVRISDQIGLVPLSATQNTLSTFAQDLLDAKAYPRGNTFFGTPGFFFDQISNDQNLTTFRNGTKAFMTEVGTGDAVPAVDLTYAPPDTPDQTVASNNVPPGTTKSIIGTPRQTPEGVIFTVMLDPRLAVRLPVQVVQLVNVLPTQLPIQIPGPPITPLGNLLYFVVQVRHFGDSRGNDWYTEITGTSTTFAATLLDGVSVANSQ